MHCPYTFDLAGAAPSQLDCSLDGLTGTAKRNNALVGRSVGRATGVFASCFGKLDALTLPFASGFIVVAGHLQGQLQKQLLNRLQDDFCDSVGLGRNVGEIDQPRHRQLCSRGPDPAHKLLGLGQR